MVGSLGGMETKEVATYGTALGETVAGECAMRVGEARVIGENLEVEELG